MPSKVAVIGAHGYIGHAVTEALLRRGFDVTMVVKHDEHKEHKQLAEQRRVHLQIGDLHNLQEIIPKLLDMDVIINCAYDPHATEDAERKAVDALLDLQRQAKEKHRKDMAIILTTGCMVLGNSDESAQITEDSKVEPPRGMAWRYELEQKLQRDGHRVAIVRPGFVWGKVGSHGVKAFESLKRDKKLHVIGQPGAKTPWIHVDDLAEQYALLAEKLASPDANRFSGVYNFVDGRPSIEHKEIWQAFITSAKKHLNIEARLEHMPIEQARQNMGDFADLMALRQGHVQAHRVKQLGFQAPKHGTPLEEIDVWVQDLQAAHR